MIPRYRLDRTDNWPLKDASGDWVKWSDVRNLLMIQEDTVTLSPKAVMDLVADVRDIFARTGVFDTEGGFSDLKGSEVAMAVSEIEVALTKRGLDVPPDLDRVIRSAPAILAIIGIR